MNVVVQFQFYFFLKKKCCGIEWYNFKLPQVTWYFWSDFTAYRQKHAELLTIGMFCRVINEIKTDKNNETLGKVGLLKNINDTARVENMYLLY